MKSFTHNGQEIHKAITIRGEKQRFHFRFDFSGTTLVNGDSEGFKGILTNVGLEAKKAKDAAEDNWWSHTFPSMEFEAYNKKDLWADVCEYVACYRPGRKSSIECNGKTFVAHR